MSPLLGEHTLIQSQDTNLFFLLNSEQALETRGKEQEHAHWQKRSDCATKYISGGRDSQIGWTA